ncbi:MAG: DUF2304 family protein [Proteobacteria bacterium]|nr:DUF2304 family protein [Pseudomonadota bacterium]
MLKYQIFFGTIVLLIILKKFFAFKRKEIKGSKFFLFLIFWLSVFLAIIFPEETNKIARFFNITRGADFFIYISIMVIFYLLFKIYQRLENIEGNITKIVREIALLKKEEDK